jgi:hypothetical protein
MKANPKVLVAGAVAVAAAVGAWFASHSFQVYNVTTTSDGYARTPSRWFFTKKSAMAYAAAQMGGIDFVGAFVADRSGGVLEAYHGHFLNGEEIDAIIVDAGKKGLQLDVTA